jgi:hypothetical protein
VPNLAATKEPIALAHANPSYTFKCPDAIMISHCVDTTFSINKTEFPFALDLFVRGLCWRGWWWWWSRDTWRQQQHTAAAAAMASGRVQRAESHHGHFRTNLFKASSLASMPRLASHMSHDVMSHQDAKDTA